MGYARYVRKNKGVKSPILRCRKNCIRKGNRYTCPNYANYGQCPIRSRHGPIYVTVIVTGENTFFFGAGIDSMQKGTDMGRKDKGFEP